MRHFTISCTFSSGKNVKKAFISTFFLLLLVFRTVSSLRCGEVSYLSVRTYYPTEDELSFRSLYLRTALHYTHSPKITLHASLLKGQGEPGYYPRGYFGDSERGLYEQGSYYIHATELLKFRQIIIGNYLPLFGQGLLFGGIGGLILSNPYYDLPRYRDGIQPSGSTSKNVLLEGIALERQWSSFSLRPFFSWNSYDCSAGESDYYRYCDNDCDDEPNVSDDDDFTGIGEGFGRRYSCKTDLNTCIRGDSDYAGESGRAKRNNLAEYVAGVNLSFQGRELKGGSTVVYTRFNRLVDPYYNLKPDEGDKTAHWFRGRDYYSSNLYFKLYRPVELFGEIVGSSARSLSYYPEFNGNRNTAVGFSGGMRHKIGSTGLILWGAYLPAHLINPHALELPDGCNNLASGLLGVHRSKKRRQFTGWVYLHRELFNEDDPDEKEGGVECRYRIQLPFGKPTTVKIDQSFEITDHHYYAPSVWSYRVTSKGSVSHSLGDSASLVFRIENRTGGPEGTAPVTGIGISGELLLTGEGKKSTFSLMYFNTAENRFAYLYPYERSLYSWSFVPQAVYGNGLLSGFTFFMDFKELALGTKVRLKLDLAGGERHGIDLYGLSEYRF